MKHLSFLLLVIWLSGKARLPAEDNPFLNSPALPMKGGVSLPLQDWQTVWSAASQPPAKPSSKPPLAAALQSALYSARIEGEVLHCDVVFQVRSFSEDWQTLPLASGEWSLDAVELPAGIAIVRHEDALCAMLHGTGDFEIKLPLSVPLKGGLAKLHIFPAAAQRFNLAKDDSARVLKLNGNAVCVLPPQGGEVTLQLEDAAPTTPPKPSQWTADAQALVQFQDGTLNYLARLYLRAEQGLGTEASLTLPSNAQVIEVTGDDLASWRVQRSPDGAQRIVSLRWATADRLDRKVQLHYEMPQSPVAAEWSLIAPQSDQAGRCLFALAPLEGIEYAHAAMTKTDAGQVIAWMREATSISQLLLIEGSAVEKLTARALPRMETAQATITNASASTKLVADGSVLHELGYEFTHRGLLTWLVEVPEEATLLSCKVNDQDARPIQRAQRQLEFSLTGKSGSSTTSKICLTYHLKGKAWDRLSGESAIALPKTSLFTQALIWQVELPEGYETTATEGTVSITTATGSASARTVAFQKQLFANEAPEVALFYQRIDLAN